MFRPSLVLSTAAILVIGAPAARAGDDAMLAQNLFGAAIRAKSHLCLTRAYDARHLAAHPDQRVSAMRILVTRETMAEYGGAERYRFRLSARIAGKAGTFESSGECAASGDARHALVCGVDCDGGGVTLAPHSAVQPVSATVDHLRIWRPGAEPEEAAAHEQAISGRRDRDFRLDRAPIEDCAELLPANERPQQLSLR